MVPDCLLGVSDCLLGFLDCYWAFSAIPIYCLGGRKDETLTRILSFWARKLASELTPNGTIWLQINFWRRGFRFIFWCASFCIFKKKEKEGFGVSGTKKKNRWRVRSVKNSKNDFRGFPDFSLGQIIKTRHTSMRMIFPRLPNLPKPSKHVTTIGK